MPKLSQMNTGEHIDTFCELVDIADSIISDKALMKTLSDMFNIGADLTNQQAFKILFDNKSTLINLILKEKRNEVFRVIAIINDKTVEEINNQSLMQTVKDAMEIFQDKELIAFFKSHTSANED